MTRATRLPLLTVWALWLTYGSFYFCRVNISAAVPGLKAEFGFDNAQIGLILGGLKLAYALGQFVNGQMAERVSPKRMLAVGMLGSAALNVVFGWGPGLGFLMFVWALNGYAQALGWTPTMRIATNWLTLDGRGRGIGIIGTSYQVSAAVTYVIAGASAEYWGWRGALYLPAALLAVSAIHMLLTLRSAPPQGPVHDLPDRGSGPAAVRGTLAANIRHAPDNPAGTLAANIRDTLTNPALWALALALGFLNANRYGFLDWGLTHVTEVQGIGIGKAALKYAILPIGGVFGTLLAGWVTDRFLGGRRAPVIVGILVALALLTWLYRDVVTAGPLTIGVVLVSVGFTLYGAHVLLVGAAPVDLARPGTAAAAVGFVNFMGYMGAYAGDTITGYLADVSGWDAAVTFWAVCPGLAAVCAAALWNRKAR